MLDLYSIPLIDMFIFNIKFKDKLCFEINEHLIQNK